MITAAKSITSMRVIKIVGLLLVAAYLYTYFFPSTAALKIPIKEQLQALQVEDYVAAYSYTTQNFQKNTSLDAFKSFINDYSGLRNNQDIRFEQRTIRNRAGTVKAVLVARGGKTTAITYRLVNEKDQWKIEAMQVNAEVDEDAIVRNDNDIKPTVTTASATAPTSAPVAAPSKPVKEPTSTYSDARFNFSMEYPASWESTNTENGTIIFQKKDNSSNHQILFTVQPIVISNGEPAPSVQQVLDFGEDAIRQKSGTYKIVEDGLLPSGANKNENYHGHYVIYSYNLNGQDIKQLQIVYFKSPKRALFVMDFIAPESEFDANLPDARTMIASFTVS